MATTTSTEPWTVVLERNYGQRAATVHGFQLFTHTDGIYVCLAYYLETRPDTVKRIQEQLPQVIITNQRVCLPTRLWNLRGKVIKTLASTNFGVELRLANSTNVRLCLGIKLDSVEDTERVLLQDFDVRARAGEGDRRIQFINLVSRSNAPQIMCDERMWKTAPMKALVREVLQTGVFQPTFPVELNPGLAFDSAWDWPPEPKPAPPPTACVAGIDECEICMTRPADVVLKPCNCCNVCMQCWTTAPKPNGERCLHCQQFVASYESLGTS